MSDWTPLPLLSESFDTSSATPGLAGDVLAGLPAPPKRVRPSKARREESDYVVPHHETFTSVWNRGIRTYWYRSDEALRRSIVDALAMRRDATIDACLRRRQVPVSSLPIVVEPDDPKDPGQRAVAQRATKLIDSTPYFQMMKKSLLEAIFFGKAGAQILWGRRTVDGRQSVAVVDWFPVHGDKILFKWNGTPGVLMNMYAVDKLKPSVKRNVETVTGAFGPAVFLRSEALRRRFIIHQFERTDQDYVHEADLAGAVHGIGLRSRLFNIWNLRNDVLAWALDAIQRVGANGGIAGFYPHGNDSARDSMDDALANLVRDHIATIPYVEGTKPDDLIKQLPVNATGYDVLKVFTDYFEMGVREIILGEQGPGSPVNTRLAAELVEEGRFSMQRADANNLAETLTNDLLQPLIYFNHDEFCELAGRPSIDFGMKLKLQLDKPNSIEDLQSAQLLIGIIQAHAQLQAMGVNVPIDIEALVEKSGLMPPESDQQQGQAGQPGMAGDPNAAMMAQAIGQAGDVENPTGPGGFEANPRVRTERPTENRGGDPSRYSSGVSRERYAWEVAPAGAADAARPLTQKQYKVAPAPAAMRPTPPPPAPSAVPPPAPSVSRAQAPAKKAAPPATSGKGSSAAGRSAAVEPAGRDLLDDPAMREFLDNAEGYDPNEVFFGKEAARRLEEPFDGVIGGKDSPQAVKPESFPGENATWGRESDEDEPPGILAAESMPDFPTRDNPLTDSFAGQGMSSSARRQKTYAIWSEDHAGNTWKIVNPHATEEQLREGVGEYTIEKRGEYGVPQCDCPDHRRATSGDLAAYTCKHLKYLYGKGFMVPPTQDEILKASVAKIMKRGPQPGA